ncbi:hypothetical protein G7Y89_g5270 [Cudoniella acicularis]|uniref:Uncharacterized protein n=1 Tax=Cudoniella acicularis TaxID=354080 RepID=A0A8H4W3I9_9HELO|nr:hypothetical protein G7Y89_g5270 [Cudoniella acicularis]
MAFIPLEALKITYPNDSEDDKNLTATLHDLINGKIDPRAAAQTIDQIMVKVNEADVISYNSVPNPTAEMIENGTIRAPQPDGWLHYIWRYLGTTAMGIPPYHSGQDQLVSLFQELQCLPTRKLLRLVDGEKLEETEIWNLTPENKYNGFQQWLWELHEGHFLSVFYGEDKPEAAVAYVNFSSFLARMWAKGITAGESLSSLSYSSPFEKQEIAWTAKYADSAFQVRRYEPFACGAAIWILYAGHVIFEMCEKERRVWGRMSREKWGIWKRKLEVVREDGRFGGDNRKLVALAVELMVRIEAEGIDVHAGGFSEMYGWTSSWREEDDGEEEDEMDD